MSQRRCLTVLAAICLLGLVNCNTGNLQVGSKVESISATGGTPQSHAVGGSFAEPLVATVTTNGTPASGVVVTFTAPTTGAGGTFDDTHAASSKATTDSNGIATSAAFVANSTTGSYGVMASAAGLSASATFELSNTTGAPAMAVVEAGGSQSTLHNAAFPARLTVKVMDSGHNPVSNAIVVFQAPTTGASGTFADSSTNKTTAATNQSGVAMSSILTANSTAGPDPVTATVSGVSTAAIFDLTNLAGSPAAIIAESGTPQSAAIDTPFPAPLVAGVFDSSSNPVSGVPVTFSAPTTSASGTFANGLTTETDTTGANGLATSSVFKADATTGGPYTVTAGVAGVGTAADFSMTNTLAFKNYVFYLSGQATNTSSFYTLAGAMKIDGAGNVLGGVQDYNNGIYGLTSPEPSGDAITGGTLNVSATTGRGTLTLVTNNSALGTETLGVQFVNVNHALVIEYDGTATSSGSMDVQSLPSMLSGGFAFTLSGSDPITNPVNFGGVFTISGGTTLQNGVFDTNDFGSTGSTVPDAPLSGTLTTFDSFGRGTISSTINYTQLIGSPAPVTLNYYVVGPEVLRIIDVDSFNNGGASADAAIGSAFGQGVNASKASNASLGSSVFGSSLGIAGITLANVFAAAGEFSTNSAGAFSGYGDEEETYLIGTPISSAISGTYTIANNGYGSLTINPNFYFGDIATLGIYMTDPNLNLNDPNNTTTGLGGGLIAEMDGTLCGGTGLLISQTDTSTLSFQGNYAFGAQAQTIAGVNGTTGEFDFVGLGSVSKSQVLGGHGLLSDPFLTFGSTAELKASFSGTAQADSQNVGRYTMYIANSNPLAIKAAGNTVDYDVVLYQVSGAELLWVNVNADDTSEFLGSLQEMGSLAGLPAAQRAGAKPW
jgi:hypothetical protein